jgi:carbon monoxide dehydrogenase subunit G
MDVVSSGQTIAQKQFAVRAPQPRVWDLLSMVTYQELPLEQVDIVSLDQFRAVLRWGIGFLHLPFYVEGKLVETLRPESYGCVILVKGGPIQIDVKVTMKLRTVDENQTEVFCVAKEEGKGTLMGLVLRRLQRNFALKMFDSIGARLQRLCS